MSYWVNQPTTTSNATYTKYAYGGKLNTTFAKNRRKEYRSISLGSVTSYKYSVYVDEKNSQGSTVVKVGDTAESWKSYYQTPSGILLDENQYELPSCGFTFIFAYFQIENAKKFQITAVDLDEIRQILNTCLIETIQEWYPDCDLWPMTGVHGVVEDGGSATCLMRNNGRYLSQSNTGSGSGFNKDGEVFMKWYSDLSKPTITNINNNLTLSNGKTPFAQYTYDGSNVYASPGVTTNGYAILNKAGTDPFPTLSSAFYITEIEPQEIAPYPYIPLREDGYLHTFSYLSFDFTKYETTGKYYPEGTYYLTVPTTPEPILTPPLTVIRTPITGNTWTTYFGIWAFGRPRTHTLYPAIDNDDLPPEKTEEES